MIQVNLADVPPHSGPLGPTPARRAWSVRRTTTIDTTWPDGLGKPMHMEGRGRDLLTGAAPGAALVLAEDGFIATVSVERQILALSTSPPRPGAASLVGSRAGSQLRKDIATALPDDLASGNALYLLLDDMAGASLVAHWAWSQWTTNWFQDLHADDRNIDDRRRKMVGVCVGFSENSPVIIDGPETQPNLNRPVPQLDANGDPLGWHALTVQDTCAARRARRIDVWLDGPVVRVETHFQDSAPMPAGGRTAVHEYLVHVTIDRATMTLTALDADPRILPFGYCPAATLNTGRVVGTPVGELRQRVLAEFPKDEGCTHLNDTMRSLAEVPQLVAALEEAMHAAGVA